MIGFFFFLIFIWNSHQFSSQTDLSIELEMFFSYKNNRWREWIACQNLKVNHSIPLAVSINISFFYWLLDCGKRNLIALGSFYFMYFVISVNVDSMVDSTNKARPKTWNDQIKSNKIPIRAKSIGIKSVHALFRYLFLIFFHIFLSHCGSLCTF